jgi:hypothetical protein
VDWLGLLAHLNPVLHSSSAGARQLNLLTGERCPSSTLIKFLRNLFGDASDNIVNCYGHPRLELTLDQYYSLPYAV